MARMIKGLGWFFVALSLIALFCSILVAFDETEDRGTVLAFLMFAGFFGFPGGLIVWRHTRNERERQFRAQLTGYLRTHDRFTVEEIAKKIGRTELETDRLVAEIVSEAALDLVFHRSDRAYMHRNRIAAGAKVFDRCASCGAALNHEVVLEGETATCAYCGSSLGTDAAARAAGP